MRIFKTKLFSRFTSKERISDKKLCDEIERIESGLIDADLGFDVYKQRVARPGEGRSSGYRVIILFRAVERAFFVHGFSKNERGNISDADLKHFRELAEQMLGLNEAGIEKILDTGEIMEVICNGNENISQ